MRDRLTVHFRNRIIGHLADEGSGRISLSYTADWREDFRSGGAHPISLALPVNEGLRELDATAFVAGLLPDSTRHRTLLAEEMGIGDDPSDFAFISKLGRECAGALTILPEREPVLKSGGPSVEWLSEAQLADHLRSLPRRPLLIDDDNGVVLSLAGVNDKAAVVVKDGRVGLPRNGFPSTHIIKVDIPQLEDSVITEHFCLRLGDATGFRVPKTRLLHAEDQGFMLMNRYDRTIQDRRLIRLHQEDFCQALDVMPGKKYQRYGGPSWADCFSLAGAMVNPVETRSFLLRAAAFQFLIGNPDAHAKNYSLTYRGASGLIDPAPLYDVNNAAAFRGYFKSTKQLMAMYIGDKSEQDQVRVSDWERFAHDCGLRFGIVAQTLQGLAGDILTHMPAIQKECPDSKAIEIAVSDIRNRCHEWLDTDFQVKKARRNDDLSL